MDCWSASLREAEEQAERKRAAAINALQTKTRLNIASLTVGFTTKRLHPSAPCPAWHSYVQGNISKNRLIGSPVATAIQGSNLSPVVARTQIAVKIGPSCGRKQLRGDRRTKSPTD